MKWLIPLSELAGVTEHTGGVGRRYAALLGELAQLGVEVSVIVYPDSPILSSCTVPASVKLTIDQRFSKLPSIVRPWLRSWLFRSAAARRRPDVIFAPEWLGLASRAPRSIAVVTNLVTGIELMSEIEDSAGGTRSLMRRLRVWFQGSLERRQIHSSRHVIGCSKAIVRWYSSKYFLPDHTEVVRNCIDVSRVRSSSREAPLPEGWPVGVPVLLHAGRVEVRKGAHTSLQAFNLLAPKFPDLHLVLAGGRGFELPEWGVRGIESLLDPGLEDRVVYLGDVQNDALYRAMAESAICMVPSLWEAFGNIALEAKASNVPLVVTSGSGFDDFCHDGVDSRVVPPGDPQELSEVVSGLLANSELQISLTNTASAQVDYFDAQHVATDLKIAVERYVVAPAKPTETARIGNCRRNCRSGIPQELE